MKDALCYSLEISFFKKITSFVATKIYCHESIIFLVGGSVLCDIFFRASLTLIPFLSQGAPSGKASSVSGPLGSKLQTSSPSHKGVAAPHIG